MRSLPQGCTGMQRVVTKPIDIPVLTGLMSEEAARKAEAVGTAAARLAAASKVAALEGERVTGLKPVVLGRGGRGRGSWRGRGGTRGRA